MYHHSLDVWTIFGAVELIEVIALFSRVPGIGTEIIAASVRNPIHVTELAGADIAMRKNR